MSERLGGGEKVSCASTAAPTQGEPTWMNNVVERTVAQFATEFAERLASLTQDAYFREAVLKMGMREAAWVLHQAFEAQRTELHEQLAPMAEIPENEDRGGPLPSY